METLMSFVVIAAGLLLRLAFPILGTGILIYFLRRLDAKWKAEADLPRKPVPKVDCASIKGCSEEQQSHCEAAHADLPCWQSRRRPNGYLQESCVSCEVFTSAPIPAIRTEPRRM
jgi:hypothetical protein